MTDKIFDNGTIESKLLQHEYKDAQVVKVYGSDLVEQFTKFDSKNHDKIFLPFYVEQLAADNEKLRREIAKVESLGFKNLIVLPFEGRNKQAIKELAEHAGITKKFELVNEDEDKKPYKTVRTERSREVSDLS